MQSVLPCTCRCGAVLGGCFWQPEAGRQACLCTAGTEAAGGVRSCLLVRKAVAAGMGIGGHARLDGRARRPDPYLAATLPPERQRSLAGHAPDLQRRARVRAAAQFLSAAFEIN